MMWGLPGDSKNNDLNDKKRRKETREEEIVERIVKLVVVSKQRAQHKMLNLQSEIEVNVFFDRSQRGIGFQRGS